MLKKLLVILSVLMPLALCISCNKADKVPTAPTLNEYTLALQLNEDLNTASLQETLTYTNATGSDLNEFVFLLYPNAYTQTATDAAYFSPLSQYGGITVTSVLVDGAPQQYTVTDTVITVSLASALKNTASACINICAELTIPCCDLRFGLSDGVLNLGGFYPVIAVYENGGWRADKFCKVGDPFYAECANFGLTLACDEDLVVACSGSVLSDVCADGIRTTVYKGEGMRDFALCASYDFKVLQGISDTTTINYYYRGDAVPEAELNTAQNALTTFGNMFCKYPYSAYNVVESDFYYGGMEYSALSVIDRNCDNKEAVIIHETAHQWLGLLVGSDSVNEAWLDESAVSFLTNYYYAYNGDVAKYESLRNVDKQSYTAFFNSSHTANPNFSVNIAQNIYAYDTNYEYGMAVYTKGSLMFDAVLQVCGKDKLQKALKAYFNDNCYGFADKEALYRAFDAAKPNVSAVFEAWLTDKVHIAAVIL